MRELFYSNGVDIFGPVSLEEFSKNRYYKSTLIWYEDLPGWVNIGDCAELRHLIGTMSTPSVDDPVPKSLPNLTPPLGPIEPVKSNRKYIFIAASLFVVLLILATVYFNSRVKPGESTTPVAADTATTHKDTVAVVDSNALKEAAIKEMAAKAEEKKVYRKNWEKFIIAKPNEYTQREIGGIDDLKVIVSNNTPYKIDNLMVKVSYVKANGEAYQHEVMEFDNIEANENKELFAPKSDRGVKVTCAIISVRSSEMNFCINKEDKDFRKKKGEDPFQCENPSEIKK